MHAPSFRHKQGRSLGALLASLLALSLGGVSCSSGEGAERSSEGLSGRLILTGSSTVAPLSAEIARRFEGLHPAVRVDVQTGGSSRGIRDVREGIANIGMASRALEEGEREGLLAHTIARDGVGLIVHADNPVASLASAQIRGIYLGQIANWSEVGGRDAPITVVNKAAGRATLGVFAKALDLDEAEIQADVVIGDNEQGVKTVAGNPDAIGYVSVGTAEYNAGAGVAIKTLATTGVPAATRSGSGASLVRPLNLITKTEVGVLERAFVEYSQSSAVHDLVRDLYFVPVAEGRG